MARILIVGGSGIFGRRIAELLARQSDADLIIAGRSQERAKATAQSLIKATGRTVSDSSLDAGRTTAADLSSLRPDIVINASGPFQTQSYGLAEAAIAVGAHYIDLADATSFVTGITRLDPAAKAAGVLVVSGASSVPGLSSTVVSELRPRFQRLDAVDIAISPGNRFDPGEATTRSVLAGVGRPLRQWRQGHWQICHGWQDARRVRFKGLGPRWLGNVDVPDLQLLPKNIPELRTAGFQAGVEVPAQHFAIWALSWLVRSAVVRQPERLTRALLALKRRLSWLGSDRGGMRIVLSGITPDNRDATLTWTLVAGSGHGPFVPTLASVALCKALLSGEFLLRGALPCFALLPLADFEKAASGLDIEWDIEQA